MELSDLYYYAEDSPSGLRWKIDRYTCRDGTRLMAVKDSIAGSKDLDKSCWTVKFNNRTKMAHRVIWEIKIEAIPRGMQIDHIDGNRYNNSIDNLRCVCPTLNARNAKMKKTNSTGINGVSYGEIVRNGHITSCFRAYYCHITSGKQIFKTFSINKYGYDGAFKLACEWREKKIAELNLEGAGYTERHGKDSK